MCIERKQPKAKGLERDQDKEGGGKCVEIDKRSLGLMGCKDGTADATGNAQEGFAEPRSFSVRSGL